MAEKSVRGNPIPSGGVAATTSPGQAQAFLPDTFTIQRLGELFMARSEENCVQQNTVSLTAGQTESFIINNVGLGQSLELLVTGSVKFTNADTTNDVDISISPDFPFNLLSKILVQFNGQTVLHNLSGYELLGVMAKRGKGVLIGEAGSAGSVFSQDIARVPRSMAWIKAMDANTTLAAGDGLTGCNKVTIDKATAGEIEFGMYLELPFTMRRDLLLGLLPMQNNSVYCSVQLSVPNLIGTTAASPFYVASAVPATLTLEHSLGCKPTYNFWAIPTPNDSRLYEFFISHSYMLQTDGYVIQKSGIEGFQYQMPNNYYLMALLLTMRDSTGALLDAYAKIDNPYLSYNGTARVDRRDIKTRTARQIIQNEGILSPKGQLIWDGTDIGYLSNGCNTTKWLNMYQANNPTFMMDIDSSVNLNGKATILREQLVPATIMVV